MNGGVIAFIGVLFLGTIGYAIKSAGVGLDNLGLAGVAVAVVLVGLFAAGAAVLDER